MSRNFRNIDELNRYLKSIEHKLSSTNLQVPLNTAGNKIKNIIEESFENQTSPSGEKWQKLKPMTKMKKLKKGKSDKILRQSGDLEDNWEISQGKNEVRIFNNTKSDKGFSYGIVHQFGSDAKNIPARPFLPIDSDGELDKDVEKEILGIFEDFLKKAIL